MERRIEVDGAALRWIERGEGAPVVLVHGIPTSPAVFRHVTPRLPGARALCFEMLGYGASWAAGTGRDISVKAQARYLLGWLDAIGVERAVLVGHDLGGGVAQIAAARQPERCAGLVLINSIAYDSWPIPSVRFMRAGSPLVERMPTALLRATFATFLLRGHDDRAIAKESIAAHWPHYDHPDGPAAFARQVRSLRTRDTLEVGGRLPTLRVPTEIVWGAADRFQKVRYGRRLARDLSGRIDELPTAKHYVPEDHPEPVAAAITRVLQHARV